MTGGGAPPGALPGGLDHDAILAEVRRALGWLVQGSSAGLALSGGGDSVALAHLVTGAREDLDATVLHVRHGLRDDSADARVATLTAAKLGLPFLELPVKVAADRRTGLEAAAREARLGALAEAARARGLDAVLLAHTADDQAETVVLNLGRGSGIGGLAGMPARRRHEGVTLARPLLRVRRADLRALAARHGWEWAEDPMNADSRRRRTQVRHTVLPALGSLSGGPGDPVALLTRLADLARDDAAALEHLAAVHAAREVVAWGRVRAVRRDALSGLPPALARRVVRGMAAEVRGGLEGLSAGAVEAALRLGPGQALDMSGGVTVTCGAGWLAVAPQQTVALAWRPLPEAGAVALPEIGAHLRVVTGAGGPPPGILLPPRAQGGPGARPHAEASLPLRCEAGVRGWQAGDRVVTGRGERPVADLLGRAGVPRPVRPLVPVVVDGRDRPLWVPGVATAPLARAGERRVWLAAGGAPALG